MEMTSSANQCLVGTGKRKHDCAWEGVCFSLSHSIPQGSREPSEGTYPGHFPTHCTDCALSRCLCSHSWWYGQGALDKHKMWETFISESSIHPPCRNLPLLQTPGLLSLTASFLLCPSIDHGPAFLPGFPTPLLCKLALFIGFITSRPCGKTGQFFS